MKKASFLLFILFLIVKTPAINAQNLIFNPGCEDSLVNNEIPYWTEVVGTTWTFRASGNPPSFEGNNMFFPGVASKAELRQDIDVSTMSSAIDSSLQNFYFEGYVRVYNQNPPDHSRIILEYLDTLKTTKLDSIDLGDHTNVDEWIQLTDTTLAPVGTRFIRIRLISTRFNGSNNDGYYDGLSLTTDIPVSVSDELTNTPREFHLYQNYPNPFNPITKIKYSIPAGTQNSVSVQLIVYDVLGREVATLVDEYKSCGEYEVEFNSHSDEVQNLPSGVYFYQLKAGDYIQTKKMLLLK